MITVKDWMSKPVMHVKPEMTVLEACKYMAKHGIGAVIISNDGKKPEGILTERDILKKIVAKEKEPKKLTLDQIMTNKVLTVDIDTSLLEISKIMTKNGLRRIVVMDKGHMAGVVTSRDLLQLMAG